MNFRDRIKIPGFFKPLKNTQFGTGKPHLRPVCEKPPCRPLENDSFCYSNGKWTLNEDVFPIKNGGYSSQLC